MESIRRLDYEPTEHDLLRAIEFEGDGGRFITTMESRWYRLGEGAGGAGDAAIRWIVPRSELMWNGLNGLDIGGQPVDTVVIMVSPTSMTEMETQSERESSDSGHSENNLVRSLEMVRKYCHDDQLNASKLVLLMEDLGNSNISVCDSRMLLKLVYW